MSPGAPRLSVTIVSTSRTRLLRPAVTSSVDAPPCSSMRYCSMASNTRVDGDGATADDPEERGV